MAGKVQHEIPQLYQRGFQIPSADGKEQIYVYRRGAKPFISGINRSGAQSYFYSEPSKDGTRTLDDEITDYEGHLATLVKELRAVGLGEQANATTAAEVIAHLTTRNAHLRGAFAHGLTTMADSFTELFSDEDAVRRLIGLEGPGVTDTFRGHVVDRLAQQLPAINPALANVPEELMTRIAYAMLREQFTSFYTQQKGQIDVLIGMLSGEAKSVAADAHRKALAKSDTSNLRVAELSTLAWRVVATDEDLILPDCVALAVERDGQIHPLMMAKLSEIDTVFLPLTSRTVLIGSKREPPAFDVSEYNRAAAACSHVYFLAGSLLDQADPLMADMGNRSVVVVEAAITDGLSKSKGQTVEASGNELRPTASAFSIPVHFQGTFEEGVPKRISEAVSDLLREVAWTVPLDRLDGITVADDYPSALAALDRGMLNVSAPPTRQDEKGIGVAQCPNVVRDGVVKSHIVVQSFVAHHLLNEDDAVRTQCAYIIANQLASAGVTQTFDEALPGVLLTQQVEGLDGILQRTTYPAWSAYFASRASSAFADPSRFEIEEDVALMGLGELFETFGEARRAYRLDADMDRFLGAVLPRLGFLLEHLAGLLGHADGIETNVFEAVPALTKELEARELRAWLSDYQRDLAFLWNRRGQWDGYGEFLGLNRHAERILWLLPVVPWTMPDGAIRVEIPFVPDEDLPELPEWN